MGIIITLIMGLVIGGLASMMTPGRTPGGMLGVVLVGMAGALIADIFFNNRLLILIVAVLASVGILMVLRSTMRRA